MKLKRVLARLQKKKKRRREEDEEWRQRQNMIPTEIGRNLTKWPELLEIGWNLTQGGTGGITISDCMLVRDILAISTKMERN